MVASDVSDEAFLRRVRGLADEPCSAILLSGGQLDCSRYSLAAWDPLLIFRSKGDAVHLQTNHGNWEFHGDPLAHLDAVFTALRPSYPFILPPFCGGAVGYFAYDLKDGIEHLPQTAVDDRNLPDIFLFFPTQMLSHDRSNGTLHHVGLAGGRGNPIPTPIPKPALRLGPLTSNFSHDAYIEAVKRVRRYIRAGDVYQVNLSQRFRFPFEGSPFTLWEHLYALNPAPFYAFIQAGDHQILSTSMERFLLRQGATIETRPIKGTRKRGKTPEEDQELRRQLSTSPKDDAELSMIVDLLRNDLGRICRGRTVRVAEHKRLESYQNVHHLISIVTGELRDGISHGDMLRGTFPGGSITGCPKVRAMEIIDELEPHVRHVYTGSIGYLGWHDNVDLNIAIRTALVHQGNCFFSVGGGIVHDSDEEDEYQETLHKARTLFDLMERLEKNHER
ncbi:MAG TPA: aminodeoxychorismate synthase component I [Syntrophobacteraceae bacterium]|nr:aminodeoxychorismate synthase component I [Syntrophobacteraceae bacterium]